MLIIFLKLLLAIIALSENKPIGDKSFKTLFIFSARAICCAFCACRAFVATNGNKPITDPAPLTKPEGDVEKTLRGILYCLDNFNKFS